MRGARRRRATPGRPSGAVVIGRAAIGCPSTAEIASASSDAASVGGRDVSRRLGGSPDGRTGRRPGPDDWTSDLGCGRGGLGGGAGNGTGISDEGGR